VQPLQVNSFLNSKKLMEKKTEFLQLEQVKKTYRPRGSFFKQAERYVPALNKVSFSIQKGEIFGLIGESGSGKTTVGRLIVKLEEPDSGTIRFEGKEIRSLSGSALKKFRLKVQMIFQDPYQSLNPQFTIYDIISEPLIIHRLKNKSEHDEQVYDAMQAVQLSPPENFFGRYPHQLSGGQRQRVAIARALVLHPELIVADEPTSMLDAPISIQIFDILLKIQKKYHVAFLFISHSLAAARYLCQRIAVIYKGYLVEIGPGNEVIQNPRHPYTRALLDALPAFAHGREMRRYGTLLEKEREDFNAAGCVFYNRCSLAKIPDCSFEKPVLKNGGNGHEVACPYTV
jgi:peptide/nickel transport system ATP-binding protein